MRRFIIPLLLVAVITVSCSSNLQGKAAIPAKQACVSDDVCGDKVCGACESCESCSQDCCPNQCTDTDGGNNAIQAGQTFGVYNGQAFSYKDECMSGQYLMEYYCGGTTRDVPTNLRYACSRLGKGFRCENGACAATLSPRG